MTQSLAHTVIQPVAHMVGHEATQPLVSKGDSNSPGNDTGIINTAREMEVESPDVNGTSASKESKYPPLANPNKQILEELQAARKVMEKNDSNSATKDSKLSN